MFLESIEFCAHITFTLDVDDLIVVHVSVSLAEDRRGGVCI